MSEYTPFTAPSNIAGSWGSDGGASIPTALNTDDGDTIRLYCHNTGAGNSLSYAGLTTPLPPGTTAVKVTWIARYFAAPTAGNTFKIGILNPDNNLTYYGTTYQQSHLLSTYATYIETISLVSGGSNDGAGDVKFVADSNGDDSYYLITYMKVEATTHTVTVSSDANSAFDQEGAIIVSEGDDLTVTATPSSGYRIADVLVDGVSVGNAAGATTYAVTLNDVADDHTISVTAALYINSSMTDRGELVQFVYDFSSSFENYGLAQIVGPRGGYPWSTPQLINAGPMVRTWDGNLYAANDDNTGSSANGAIYQLETGLLDVPVRVLALTSGVDTINGSLVQGTGVITAQTATDFRRVAVGAKVTGSGITGVATVTAKSSNGNSISVSGTLTGNTTNQAYSCWGREIEAKAFGVCDRFDLMGDLVSGQFGVLAYACPTGELVAVEHSYDFGRTTSVTLPFAATGDASAMTHRAPQDRASFELPSASRTASQLQEFAIFAYNGSTGTDTEARAECWGIETTSRILQNYQ